MVIRTHSSAIEQQQNAAYLGGVRPLPERSVSWQGEHPAWRGLPEQWQLRRRWSPCRSVRRRLCSRVSFWKVRWLQTSQKESRRRRETTPEQNTASKARRKEGNSRPNFTITLITISKYISNNYDRPGRRSRILRRKQETLCKLNKGMRNLKRWRKWGTRIKNNRKDNSWRETWTCVNKSKSSSKTRWTRCSRRSCQLLTKSRMRSRKSMSMSFSLDSKNSSRMLRLNRSSRPRSRICRIESWERLQRGEPGTDRKWWGRSWKRTREGLILKLMCREWNKRS